MLPTCTFVLANGVICQGLAVKEKTRCRFHQEDADRLATIRDASTKRRCEMAQYAIGYTTICKIPGVEETFDDVAVGLFSSLNLPPIEDGNSLQVVLNAVIRALGHQVIPTKNAALILYALQISSNNMKRTRKPMEPFDKLSLDAPAPLRSIDE